MSDALENFKICAVVVTYNRKEKLKKCIQCLAAQRNISCDILIVDNASSDGTYEMVSSLLANDKLSYYNTGKNLGGAGGFEIGVEIAVKKGYDLVWIMDDDTWAKEDALWELIKVNRELNGNWGWLSSLALWTDDSICRMNIQKKDIFRHVGEKEYSRSFSAVKMCSFVSLLVKSSVIKEVGLPIGEYFIWTDDYEFTGRISRKYPCYMVTGSKVIHAMEKHTRVDFATDSDDRIDRYRYIYRNDVHCYRQYGLLGWLYIILKDLYTIVNVIVNSNKNRIRKIKTIIMGAYDGLHFKPIVKMIDDPFNNIS